MQYEQATGKLYDGEVLIGVGWAGHGNGKNNPAMENVPDIGPLPTGTYTVNDPINDTHLGPLAFPLTPAPTNQMFGRSGFYLHAAEIAHPELSSDGCIIQAHSTRVYIATKIGGTPKDSPLRQLVVV